ETEPNGQEQIAHVMPQAGGERAQRSHAFSNPKPLIGLIERCASFNNQLFQLFSIQVQFKLRLLARCDVLSDIAEPRATEWRRSDVRNGDRQPMLAGWTIVLAFE